MTRPLRAAGEGYMEIDKPTLSEYQHILSGYNNTQRQILLAETLEMYTETLYFLFGPYVFTSIKYTFLFIYMITVINNINDCLLGTESEVYALT